MKLLNNIRRIGRFFQNFVTFSEYLNFKDMVTVEPALLSGSNGKNLDSKVQNMYCMFRRMIGFENHLVIQCREIGKKGTENQFCPWVKSTSFIVGKSEQRIVLTRHNKFINALGTRTMTANLIVMKCHVTTRMYLFSSWVKRSEWMKNLRPKKNNANEKSHSVPDFRC